MHLETRQGSLDCGEIEQDAPSSTDSDDGAERNGFHEESDSADNESSNNDDEVPYNVDAFINPVYDIEDLNIEDHDDATDHDSHTGEEEPFDYFHDFDQGGNTSSSEMSDENQEDHREIGEPNNEQEDTLNNPERANLNSNQQGVSFNSDNENVHVSNVQQGALSNLEINDIESATLNSTQQGTPHNSDNLDLNNAQQGALSNSEIGITNDIERVNLNSIQQGASHNSEMEDINNVQQGALETSITNDINPNSFNDDCTKSIFVACDDDNIEPIAISTPSFGTSYSPNIYHGPHNSGFKTPESPVSVNLDALNYRGPSITGHPSSDPPYYGAQGDAGNMQTSGYCTPGFVDFETSQPSENNSGPPVFNTTILSQHQAVGNPRYATLHLLPVLRDTLLNRPPYRTAHFHFSAAGRCFPGPYSTIFTTTNNRSHPGFYSMNYNAPGNPDCTGPRLINYSCPNTHGYIAPTPHNEPTRYTASYTTPQASGYGASDNLASGKTKSTNYIAPGVIVAGTAKASAYEKPNASDYGTKTSLDSSQQLSPGRGTSVPPAYFGPHSYDYGKPYTPNYIASESSCGATYYSQYSAPPSSYPAPGCPDTVDVSKDVKSQSSVTQVLSNDEASGSTASYNYGGPGTPGYGVPSRNELTRYRASYRTPQASGYDASDNLGSGTTQSTNYIAPGAHAIRTVKTSAYWARNASDYDTLTSFDHSDQLSPGHGTLVPPTNLGPHSYDYGNPYSSHYIAPGSSSGTTHYSQYSAPSSGYPDTLHVSESVASQSAITQALSKDKASDFTASYNEGSPGTSRYGVPARNELTRYNASYRTPQASSYDASNQLAAGTTILTNYITPGVPADGTAKASVYEAPNASGYGTPTLFDRSDQVSHGNGTSVPPAYLGPHSYDYGNPYSSNYIAPQSFSGTTHYSRYSAPSSVCPDTLDLSENVTLQSPISQALSNDEASGSTASYNYGGPGTSGFGAPVTTGHGTPGSLFFCSDYTVPDSISYGSPNSTGNDASGMSGDAGIGHYGGQRGRRPRFNTGFSSRSLPNSTRRHSRGRGNPHCQ